MSQPKPLSQLLYPAAAGHNHHAPQPRRRLVLVFALLALLWLPVLASAEADASAGAAALVEEHCVSCHGSEVFTRADRRVQSLAGLTSQVRMCEQNLGLQWFDEDVQAVVALLNREYYHFDEPAAD